MSKKRSHQLDVATPPICRNEQVQQGLKRAIQCLLDCYQATYQHLPEPVRFRAAGALAAWNEVLALAGQDAKILITLLNHPYYAPLDVRSAMGAFLEKFPVHDWHTPDGELLKRQTSNGADLLTFWHRDGALIEPTQALHRLLEASDIGMEIPLALLRLPSPTLSIVAPPCLRDDPDGFNTVSIFEHLAHHEWGSSRCLTLVIHMEGRISTVVLDVVNDTESIHEGLEIARQHAFIARGTSREMDVEAPRLHRQISYVTKLLLYLSMDDACIRHEQPYSTASRQFTGLGQRKRAQRLAEIEQLYDRYIVGPALLDQEQASHGLHDGGDAHEVSAHWRRGHFRLQAHGPQASLRKVLFIKPTLVRPDRLSDAN